MLHVWLTAEPPFFRVTGPPEYEGMTTLEIFRTLDWTNGTQRNRYQEVLLEENVPMQSVCMRTDGGTNPVGL